MLSAVGSACLAVRKQFSEIAKQVPIAATFVSVIQRIESVISGMTIGMVDLQAFHFAIKLNQASD